MERLRYALSFLTTWDKAHMCESNHNEIYSAQYLRDVRCIRAIYLYIWCPGTRKCVRFTRVFVICEFVVPTYFYIAHRGRRPGIFIWYVVPEFSLYPSTLCASSTVVWIILIMQKGVSLEPCFISKTWPWYYDLAVARMSCPTIYTGQFFLTLSTPQTSIKRTFANVQIQMSRLVTSRLIRISTVC